MILITKLFKQSLNIQDKNILSGQISFNIHKINPNSEDFKSINAIDEQHTLGRVGVLCTEYGYSIRSFNYSVESRYCSGSSLSLLPAEHEVYSIEVN